MRKRIIILTCFLALLLMTSITSKAYAETSAKRIYGQDRYKTAVAISNEGWKESKYVVIAYGENYPDAVVVSPLAMKYNAPILLTGKDTLNEDTKMELSRLGTENVFIVGGEGVVSKKVETELKNMKINVTRIAGADRYETAIKVAEQLDNPKEIILATGENYPDALSVAPAAAKMGIPILLIRPNDIPDSIKEYINKNSISKAYVAGDGTIFSNDTIKHIPCTCESIYGTDRYETNQSAIRKFSNILNSNSFYVATGENYADALTGSVLAAKNNAPILFMGEQPWKPTKFIYTDYRLIDGNLMFTNYSTPIILGGKGAVSFDAENMLNNYVVILEKAKAVKSLWSSYIGQVVISGDWAYYNKITSRPWDEGTEYGENAIYKIKLDGSEITRLVFDNMDNKDINNYTDDYINKHVQEFMTFNVYTITKIENGWIYYDLFIRFPSSGEPGETRHYKIKTDGTENQLVK